MSGKLAEKAVHGSGVSIGAESFLYGDTKVLVENGWRKVKHEWLGYSHGENCQLSDCDRLGDYSVDAQRV
jgi:hypothetical protein